MPSPQVVILCGGKGTRLREHTEEIPKPLVEVGGMPILWHIMKGYARHGFTDFVLCLGYKGDKIKDFFMNFKYRKMGDLTIEKGKVTTSKKAITNNNLANWRITLADTGPETSTGGRLKKIQKYIHSKTFFVTYGDGLASIDFTDQLAYHLKHGRTATMTCVKPRNPFGVVEVNPDKLVQSYVEKPRMNQWVNGGFFVFEKKIFSAIRGNEMLEKEPLEKLSKESQLVAYEFDGFWTCMDTYKDTQMLNELWNQGPAPWET
jgi:glucose-1-phosphate cytidylyltransferase